MSGGRWNYQQWKIQDQGEELKKLLVFVDAVAESEHIVDWAECGDTVRRREDGSGAERDLYDLWLKTFDEVYGSWL
jgi:hypothetical protein